MPRRAKAETVFRFTKGLLAGLQLPSGTNERTFWDTEVPSLGLRMRSSGNRAWVIRPPRSGGQSKLHTFGSADVIDLATARKTAREKLGEVALGGDPTKAKREARAQAAAAQAAVTFGSLVPRYVANKQALGRRSSTIGNLRHHLEKHWLPLHPRPLSAITRAEVAARHREIVNENGPHAADRAMSILSTFFVWAIREGELENNPAQNTNRATVPTRRERVLTEAELAAVWQAYRDDDFGRIVRLLILTGQRRDEVAKMRWAELDLQGALWTIPAERMKNKRRHEVPLSAAALAVLHGAPAQEGRDLVFGQGEGGFSGFSKAKAALDKRVGEAVAEWTLHDLRRTVSTGMNGCGIRPDYVEIVLSHVGARAGVAGTYNRAEYRAEKREALDLWAAEVARITR